MSQERLSMRKVKEVFRLKFASGLSERQIAASCQIARSTVADYLFRGKVHGLAWEGIRELSDSEIEAKLFSKAAAPQGEQEKPWPDFKRVHEELRANAHVTLMLLWQEYREAHPHGFGQSWFYERYEAWRGKLDLVMRQDHKAGEKFFVDYCDGVYLFHPETHERFLTQLFVGVWGASNYTYAEATLTQEIPNWLASQSRAFTYFGCVPHVIVCDNLKSGVTKACRYEPELNPAYQDFALHYSLTVIPARPYEPRDKAKVEAGVLVAQRWILARLRHFCFFSLTALNAKIAELLEDLNTRPLRKMKVARRELFLTVDKPHALPLPENPFEYAAWKKARVNIDYHVEVDRHYYSVPYRFVHEAVDVRLTLSTVEVFLKGTRIASHPRSSQEHQATTLSEHRPLSHQKHAEWTPSRMIAWAGKTGVCLALLVETMLSLRPHPEQGYRAVLGLLRLERRYGKDRLEKAAERAIRYKSFSYTTVKNILKQGLDQAILEPAFSTPAALPLHENIRGSQYYETIEGGNEYVK